MSNTFQRRYITPPTMNDGRCTGCQRKVRWVDQVGYFCDSCGTIWSKFHESLPDKVAWEERTILPDLYCPEVGKIDTETEILIENVDYPNISPSPQHIVVIGGYVYATVPGKQRALRIAEEIHTTIDKHYQLQREKQEELKKASP